MVSLWFGKLFVNIIIVPLLSLRMPEEGGGNDVMVNSCALVCEDEVALVLTDLDGVIG